MPPRLLEGMHRSIRRTCSPRDRIQPSSRAISWIGRGLELSPKVDQVRRGRPMIPRNPRNNLRGAVGQALRQGRDRPPQGHRFASILFDVVKYRTDLIARMEVLLEPAAGEVPLRAVAWISGKAGRDGGRQGLTRAAVTGEVDRSRSRSRRVASAGLPTCAKGRKPGRGWRARSIRRWSRSSNTAEASRLLRSSPPACPTFGPRWNNRRRARDICSAASPSICAPRTNPLPVSVNPGFDVAMRGETFAPSNSFSINSRASSTWPGRAAS